MWALVKLLSKKARLMEREVEELRMRLEECMRERDEAEKAIVALNKLVDQLKERNSRLEARLAEAASS